MRGRKNYLEKRVNMSDVIDFQRLKDEITLGLKTFSRRTGLLLLVKGGPNEHITLKMLNGKIVFNVNYSTGMELKRDVSKLLTKMSGVLYNSDAFNYKCKCAKFIKKPQNSDKRFSFNLMMHFFQYMDVCHSV